MKSILVHTSFSPHYSIRKYINTGDGMATKRSKKLPRKAVRKEMATAKMKAREVSMKLARRIGKAMAKQHAKKAKHSASEWLVANLATSIAATVDIETNWTPSTGWAGAGYTGVALAEFTCFLKLPVELQNTIWPLVPTPGYDTKRIHSVVGFDERTIKANTKLNSMYNAHVNLGPRIAGENPTRLERAASDPNHIFFLSLIPNNLLLYVCSNARQIIIKRHNLSFIFGTWMNLDQDVILCWDGKDTRGQTHHWDQKDSMRNPIPACDCQAWLSEMMDDEAMQKVRKLVVCNWDWAVANNIDPFGPDVCLSPKLEKLRETLPNLDSIYAATEWSFWASQNIYGVEKHILDQLSYSKNNLPSYYKLISYDFSVFLGYAQTVALL